MSKDAVSKTVQRAIIGGFWYTRNPPDVTGPSSPVLTQTPVPHVTSIDVTWVNGIDAQSGIASTYAEVSVHGLNVWTRTVLAWPASSTTFTGLTSGTAYDIRLANVDASANANVSPYSAVATVSTLGSPIDLAPGTLALTVSSVTVNEGGSLSLGVARSGAGTASPNTSVDWQFGGLNQGSPSPANGTLTWIGGDNSTQFIVTTAGAVTSTQTGTLKLLNPRAASGNITPTLGLASVPVTIIADVISGIKWNPGDYGGSQNPTYRDDRKLQQQIVEQNLVLSSGANVLGWNGYYFPAALESAPGVFDFTQVLRDLNRLRSMSTPKRIIITVIPQFYGSVNYGVIVPPTIVNTSSYGASPVAGKYGWWNAQGNTSAVLAWWRPAVMDWVISMFQALAATVNPSTGLTFDADPYVELTSFSELAVGADSGDAGYSTAALLAQYKRLIDAINIAWPTTLHACQNNINANPPLAQDLTNYCYAHRTAVSSPDTFVAGQKSQPLTGGQAAAIGVGVPGTGFTGPDLRGQVAMISFTQGPEISNPARYPMYTPHTFHTQINNVLQQSHRIFTMVSTSATNDPIPAYPADGSNTGANPGNWHSILQVINGSPLTHITKPTSLVSTPPALPGVFPNFPYDETRTAVSGAYYVDPVSGNDAHDGRLVAQGGTGPKRTINAALPLMGPGVTVYLMNGTHTVTPFNAKFVGASGTAGSPAEITSLPGHSPVIDCGGGNWLNLDNKNYWSMTFLKFQNYVSAVVLAQDVTCTGLYFFCIDGSTALGGDNVSLINVIDATTTPGLVIDRYRNRLTVAPGTVHANTSGLYFKRTSASIATLNHLEIYNFPIDIYHKHGEPVPSVNGNCTISNSFLQGASRNCAGYNPSGIKYSNVIFSTGVILAEDDGGEAGDLNWYDHCTFYVSYTGTNQNGSPQPGAVNNKFTNSVINALILQSPSTVKTDSDYNLFPSGSINRYGVTQTLAQWRVSNGSDAHSVQGTPNYVGPDFSTLTAYALQTGSPGKGAASGGTDMGVDVTTIGVHAA